MPSQISVVSIQQPIQATEKWAVCDWVREQWPSVRQACPNGWAILQSHTELRFCRVAGLPQPNDDPTSAGWLETVFQGRVFDETQEIRWTNDGLWVTQWTIRESAPAPGGVEYERRTEKYYLWGIWTGQGASFLEGRLTSPQEYPVAPQDLQKNDRARIWAYEYRERRQDSTFSTAQDWTDYLNRPHVVFSRLYAVDAGQDEEPR